MLSQKIAFLFALGCTAFATAKSEQGGGKVTCKASPELVEIGETATVTCHFPTDISRLKPVWVTVGHFPYNEPEREHAVELVECMKTNTPELECTVLGEGYGIESVAERSLKLRITNISAQHSGRFLCQMLLPEGEIPKLEMCSLSVLGGGKVTCKASPEQVELRETATVTCHFPSDVRQMTTAWVTVGHFPYNEPEREHAVELVDCIKSYTPELKCTLLQEGYTVDGEVEASLKLRITNISAQQSGRFLCQMVPPKGMRPKPEMCSLSVLEVTQRGLTATETATETSTGVQRNATDGNEETNAVVIITSVVVVGLLVIAAVVIILCTRKTGRDGRRYTFRPPERLTEPARNAFRYLRPYMNRLRNRFGPKQRGNTGIQMQRR